MVWILVIVHLFKIDAHVEFIGVFETQEVCNIATKKYKDANNQFPKNTSAVCILSDKKQIP
tara:strand:- start:8248 stop:8430 length:183 start_codon:yes stop_codon:yes gene_type:complete